MEYLKLILFSFLFIISVFSFISLAPWVPTKRNDLNRINDILKLKKWEKFLEMWCWTGLVSIHIARKNPNSKIIWIELSPLFYVISKIRVFFSDLKNIKIKYWNALNLNLEDYDVIYIFWLPKIIKKKVLPRLSKINNKKFRFISYCFKIRNDIFIENKYEIKNKNTIYEYKI